jgi:hypothetical protein
MQAYFAMGGYTPVNKAVQEIFMQTPFIFELRVFIDWTFTRTALDVFQWIKLAKIQADLFKAKCLNKSYFNKPLDIPIPKWQKYLIGYSLIAVIILLFTGPMFLFSSEFSFIGSLNPISKASVKLSLQITNNEQEGSNQVIFSKQELFSSPTQSSLHNLT